MPISNLLPNNYAGNNKPYIRPIPDGLETSFFLNTAEGTVSPLSGNLRLSIFDGYGTEVISGAGTIQTTTASGGGYRVYVENMILTGLNIGQVYRPYIYDITTNLVVFKLNCFRFVAVEDKYIEVAYKNSSSIFNYDYAQIPDFRNKIFLDLNVVDNQGEYEIKQYAEASTGFIRNQKSQLKSFVSIQAEFFDQISHDGMKGLSLHDDILLNGSPYQTKEGYVKETDIRSNREKGIIEMYDQDLNEINLNI